MTQAGQNKSQGILSWVTAFGFVFALALLTAYSGSEKLFDLPLLSAAVVLLGLLFIFTNQNVEKRLTALAAAFILGTTIGWLSSGFLTGLIEPNAAGRTPLDSCALPYSPILCVPTHSWSTNMLLLAAVFMPWTLLLPVGVYSVVHSLGGPHLRSARFDFPVLLLLLVWVCLAAVEPALSASYSLAAAVGLTYFIGVGIERCPNTGLGITAFRLSSILVFLVCIVLGVLLSAVLYLSYVHTPVEGHHALFSPEISRQAAIIINLFSQSIPLYIVAIAALGIGVLAAQHLWQGQGRKAVWSLGTSAALYALCAKLILIPELVQQLNQGSL